MRADDLDMVTMTRLLGDLAAAHGKPFGAAAEKQVRVYREALADFSCAEVEAAVRHACKAFDRFPKPAQLRAMCYAARPKRTLHHDDPSDACRDCGTAYQWRRLPHWAHVEMGTMAAHDLQCDCGWRAIVRAYATEEDLADMGDDPFAENELRYRAAKHSHPRAA